MLRRQPDPVGLNHRVARGRTDVAIRLDHHTALAGQSVALGQNLPDIQVAQRLIEQHVAIAGICVHRAAGCDADSALRYGPRRCTYAAAGLQIECRARDQRRLVGLHDVLVVKSLEAEVAASRQ